MAKNDIVIIDNIIQERLKSKIPSNDIGEVFEFFSIEQLLKDYDLSVEQIKEGITDGRNDGGIDGFYIFINGNYLEDINSFTWPKKSCELKVFLTSVKHHATFEKALLDDQYSTLCELFDLSLDIKDFKAQYNEEILHKRTLFVQAYRKISANLASMEIEFYYLSRGDSKIVGENIIARSNQIHTEIKNFFSDCYVKYFFWGSSELIAQYRKNKDFKLNLNYSRVLNQRGHNFIALCPISDYFKFITFNDGKLRRYLFDSNVRAYMGLNRVNDDILFSLKNKTDVDFWWLNNGITILSSGARDLGSYLEIDNVQIVNGLQTSETIYYYFTNDSVQKGERNILIKIISEVTNEIGDEIIKATNNQTAVSVASLHATDKIHRDIEDVMLKKGLFYERRINYYYNQGKDMDLIYSPLYLASGYVALVLKNLIGARALKEKFMNNPYMYNKIYGEDNPLNLWPQIAQILRKTDIFLEHKRLEKGFKCFEGFLKGTRYIVSFIAVSYILKDFNFSINSIVNFDLEKLTNELYEKIWNFITENQTKEFQKNIWRKNDFIEDCLKRANTEFGIDNIDSITKRKPLEYGTATNFNRIDDDTINLVDKELPNQPWKPGINLLVSKKLNISPTKVSQAISYLIFSNRRYNQKDGVVYDANGNVLMIDEERVDKDSLKLKKL